MRPPAPQHSLTADLRYPCSSRKGWGSSARPQQKREQRSPRPAPSPGLPAPPGGGQLRLPMRLPAPHHSLPEPSAIPAAAGEAGGQAYAPSRSGGPARCGPPLPQEAATGTPRRARACRSYPRAFQAPNTHSQQPSDAPAAAREAVHRAHAPSSSVNHTYPGPALIPGTPCRQGPAPPSGGLHPLGPHLQQPSHTPAASGVTGRQGHAHSSSSCPPLPGARAGRTPPYQPGAAPPAQAPLAPAALKQ